MQKRVSAAAIHKLKDALSVIFWYKKDLRGFLQSCMSDKLLIAQADWSQYKRRIVDEIVGAMAAKQEVYFDDLLHVLSDVCDMRDFSHLERLEDGKEKAKDAKKAVAALRKVMQSHEDLEAEKRAIEERRRKSAEKRRMQTDWDARLTQLRENYLALLGKKPQRRGYDLEELMRELFDLFDLDPKASFRNTGEQIDGAFSFDGTDYLFEAKWHNDPVGVQDLDGFGSKVRRNLENTLGLFLSINGFSDDGVTRHSTGQPVLILMTGADLIAVLENRIDLTELLRRKRRHASQTGNILLTVQEILSSDTSSC